MAYAKKPSHATVPLSSARNGPPPPPPITKLIRNQEDTVRYIKGTVRYIKFCFDAHFEILEELSVKWCIIYCFTKSNEHLYIDDAYFHLIKGLGGSTLETMTLSLAPLQLK